VYICVRTYVYICMCVYTPRGEVAEHVKYVAVCCSVMQCVAVCCSRVAVCCSHLRVKSLSISSMLQCDAACCSVSLCVHLGVKSLSNQACCSELQSVSECCSVLQCVAGTLGRLAEHIKCVAVCGSVW